jgi:hypothetical protein
MSVHIVDDEQRSDRRATPMRPSGSGGAGASAALALLDGVLEAHYPPELPTHSPVQRFHFDLKTGLLCRHDCTLEAVGPWARVTQIVDHYRERDGIPYFGLRTVYFRRRDDSRIPWPTLIVGRVFDWKLCADP